MQPEGKTTASPAAKKITLSFIPATQADLDLINSYLPKPHPDGSPWGRQH